VLPEPVALALDVDGDGAVEEAVEDGCGHDLVGEDVAPGAPGFVGGDDHGFGPVVAFGDDFEEEGSFGPFKRKWCQVHGCSIMIVMGGHEDAASFEDSL